VLPNVSFPLIGIEELSKHQLFEGVSTDVYGYGTAK
jgi:hypothetical protein